MFKAAAIAMIFTATAASASDRFSARHSLMPTPPPTTQAQESEKPTTPQLPIVEDKVVLKPLELDEAARTNYLPPLEELRRTLAERSDQPARAHVSSYLNVATARSGLAHFTAKYPQLGRLEHKIEPGEGGIFRLMILGTYGDLTRLCTEMNVLSDNCSVE
ncbi:MAG: hypothetical protein FWD15_05955 [Alphaproteobacteria bacterium]|nr:hypothetical protein [Alphaproteobacteria bacterium]